MELSQHLLRMVISNLPKVAGLLPEKIRKRTLARINDFNPFATLGAKDDLARALRLAWIEAALKLDESARDACRSPDWISHAGDVKKFSDVLRNRLKALRDVVFDRDIPLPELSIDQHLQALIVQAPATLTGRQVDTSQAITVEFEKIIADIVGCTLSDVPDLYQDMAERGLLTSGGSSDCSFGDMVLLVFTELIQDPRRYSIAGSAFAIATNSLAVELGQQCLKMLEGQDKRFDTLLERLDVTSDGGGLKEWLGHVDVALASAFETLSVQLNGLDTKIDQSLEAAYKVDSRMAQIEQLVAEVAAKLGNDIDPRAHQIIIDQAQRLRPDQLMDFSGAVKEIEYAVCAALDLIRTGGTSRYKDRFVDDAHTSVSRSIESGQVDQGSQTIDQALAELDRREECEREIAKRQRKQLLNLSIQHGTVALAPHRVADAEEKLLGLEHPECPVMSEAYRDRFVYYFQEGEARGVNFLLDVAVVLARKRVEHACSNYESSEALSWLGKSLARLGERASSPELLLQAEQVFREAVVLTLQAGMPTDWAMAQNGLANVLQVLGRREHSSDRFHESVRIYESVLSFFVKENLSLQVAEVSANLGAVQLAIGGREGNPGLLYKAVHSLKAALAETALEDVPLVWAMAQNNLGSALRLIGEREGDIELLRAAVEAYRSALRKRSQDVAPFLWATTQGDLGTALLTLGERTENTGLIRAAIDTFQAALSSRPREVAPLEWATIQHNLGTACLRIGEFDNDILMLNQAKEAYGCALQERTPLRGLTRWAGTISGLGNVFLALGLREQSLEQLLKAKKAYEEALDHLSYEDQPWDWALNKHNLGNALLSLADYEDGTESLEAAVRAYQDALRVRTPDCASAAWGRTKFSLGRAFLALSERQAGTKHLERAIQEYQCAFPKLSQQQRESAEHGIAFAQEMIKRSGG
ncbi:tetratricopeptide repeat protein [Pseudomonas citronellolis]|uniref:tetratricopeptide repeat protein n=1 Tax=Pseudomonas citronellolis TaxID=53408 RepID=UPI002648D654|nr:tetratricopeptide repeat protein [Pseudomonas citronellolis]MDN6873705.1 tetratricopeptide repeat protein [Pseudomonas citronellolis]